MSDSQSTLKTLSGLSDTLARVAGVLVGLSGLAYFVGYRIESHYLAQAGASWVLGLLSTSEIIRKGQGVILVVGFTLFFSIINIFETNASSEKLKQKELSYPRQSRGFIFVSPSKGQKYEAPEGADSHT